MNLELQRTKKTGEEKICAQKAAIKEDCVIPSSKMLKMPILSTLSRLKTCIETKKKKVLQRKTNKISEPL